MRREQLLQSAKSYAVKRGIDILGTLGDGTQGIVWKVRDKKKLHPWALKIHDSQTPFEIEVSVYERLRGVHKLEGFNIPVMLGKDDEWRAIELGMVGPPYVLDFAQSYLDWPPEFSAEVWHDTHRKWKTMYGDQWPSVQRLLGALEDLGIHYLDVHPGNITLPP